MAIRHKAFDREVPQCVLANKLDARHILAQVNLIQKHFMSLLLQTMWTLFMRIYVWLFKTRWQVSPSLHKTLTSKFTITYFLFNANSSILDLTQVINLIFLLFFFFPPPQKKKEQGQLLLPNPTHLLPHWLAISACLNLQTLQTDYGWYFHLGAAGDVR